MTEEQMRAECSAIQAEWQMGGLAGGLYEDFAVELAKRVQAAERERWKAMMQRAIGTCFDEYSYKEVMSDPQHFAAEALRN